MVNKQVIDTFKQFCSNWFGETNEYDCFYRKIPDGVKNEVRQNFGINFNEDIIFVRDTSFWNSKNQGCVITDVAIYVIPDNDSPNEKVVLPWNILKNVIYRDLMLYFFGYNGDDDNCPIHITYFLKTDEEGKQTQLGPRLASLFSSVCNVFEQPQDPFDVAYEKYESLLKAGKDDEALLYAINVYNSGIERAEIFCLYISNGYCQQEKYQKALEYCDKGIQKAEIGSRLYLKLIYLKEVICSAVLSEWKTAREYAFLTVKYAGDEKRDDGMLVKEDAQNDFEEAEAAYIEGFLNLPYNERKVLLPVKEYTDLSQQHIAVVNIKNLPQIEFPIGHPIANQLYIGHPFLPNKYIPFENYQLELIEDKVREFCDIAQCLGATEITIYTENNSQSNASRNYSSDVNGGASYGVVGTNGGMKKEGKRDLMEEISQAINLHQTFTPTKKPYLPSNTKWYQNEPSWQRLYQQRINGGLNRHEERIETRKSQMVDNHELMEVKAELQILYTSANLNWNSSLDEKFSQQENAVLSIQVEFAPIDSIGQIPSTSSNSLTDKEQEYLDNLKDFLEDDAEITPRERKMLDRIRLSLGISEERAQELEASLKPQLTEDEQEYLEMYREYMEKGEITEKERRRLDKFASALDISEERRKELERIDTYN